MAEMRRERSEEQSDNNNKPRETNEIRFDDLTLAILCLAISVLFIFIMLLLRSKR